MGISSVNGVQNGIEGTCQYLNWLQETEGSIEITADNLVAEDLKEYTEGEIITGISDVTTQHTDSMDIYVTAHEAYMLLNLSMSLKKDDLKNYELFGFIYHFEANDLDSGVVCSFNLKNTVNTILQTGKIG